MAKEKKRLIIIDGNALVHRAYHALPPLSTKKGEIVNAVYGFLLVFLKVIKEFQPDFIAATFDLAAPTFRHEKFKDYKATRPKAPDELYYQLPKVKEVLKNFNVPVFEKEGFEADDIIGTIARLVQKNQIATKIETIILSGDLDTLQLVDDYTKVYTFKKGIKDTILYDEKAVKEKYDGLVPKQLSDFKALKGDPSDNVPGVPGIGDKTAISLMKEFKNLENLYKEIRKIKTLAQGGEKKGVLNPRILNLLKEYKDQAFFNKTLVDINKDAPIDFDLEMSRWGDYDQEKVAQILKEFEFYSLIERLPKTSKEKGVKTATLNLGTPVGMLQQIENLERDGVFSKEVYEIEKNLVPVIDMIEKNGIKIDLKALKELSEKLEAKINELQSKIHKSAGAEFNINSPQQLSEIIFQKLKISIKGLKKTPGGVVSTSFLELEKLKNEHQIINQILEYRELFKLKSGFVDVLPGWINQKDGRIHPKFDQLGTVTGRFSCSDPNLQNIPIKGELGKEIRKCFVAEASSKFLSADYSQMELRIAASIANDKDMIQFFGEGKDIHKITAAKIFKVPEEKVDKNMRAVAKTLNFGVLYGMGTYGFAEAAKVSRKEAKLFIEEYFKNFKGIDNYVKDSVEKAKKNGFVETIFGRKRFLPEINSLDPRLQRAAERMAINHPVQGTAADIIKMAMIKCHEVIGPYRDQAKMVLQVHDELLFEINEKEILGLAKKIKEIMEGVAKLQVPLKIDSEIGKNWGELEKID
jgi:DNA polymerase-1